MGLPVPNMVMPTNPPPPHPKPPFPKGPPPVARSHSLASCASCGAPHEARASVCGYCLTPSLMNLTVGQPAPIYR